MSKQRKLWRLAAADSELRKRLSQHLRIPEVISELLINRGLCNEREAVEFLNGNINSLHDPFLLQDMKPAVERTQQAILKREKITIYGDYDVDGITATALMFRVLKEIGAEVNYYIPDRQIEGYGLNSTALNMLYESGTNLIVTVDCGINAVNEINAVAKKMDIIISDHHEPSEILPGAYAVLNPKRADCNYPDKNLAGVGVAFKLCQALWKVFKGGDTSIFEYLDLVSVGSIADIVPLLGENRIMVKYGLKYIMKTGNVGLSALIATCNLENIDAGKIGFVLAPRLNAAGRIGCAAAGVELLVTDDKQRALELSLFLDEQNVQRQAVEKDILLAAETLVDEVDIKTSKVLVLSGVDWHPGVIGIVASRLVDKYFRPVVIISETNGVGKGSCRSIPGFDLHRALSECEDILLKFGGHRMAAGLSISVTDIPKLRERLNSIADKVLTEEDFIPVLTIDTVISLQEVNSAFLEQLACLAPHGMGNPKPVFASNDVSLINTKLLGREGRHLKLTVRQQNSSQNVISWEMGHMLEQLSYNPNIDLAFVPEFNEWQGRRSIQLCAYDIKLTSTEQNGNNRDIKKERTAVGHVYLTLKALTGQKKPVQRISQIASEVTARYATELTNEGIKVSLKILEELGLLKWSLCEDVVTLSLCPPPGRKMNIEQSITFCEGKLAEHIMLLR